MPTRLFETVERHRAELARFLSPEVAALVSSGEGAQLLAGHRAHITVVYFDLREFTAFAETAEPEELIEVVREYHAVAGELIVAHGGTLEHVAGDGLMVFFNDQVPLGDHELQAARLASAMRERIRELAGGWRKRGYDLGLRAGIAVGHATLGRIGFEGHYDYGALGTVTNLASRLSDEAAYGQILLSQRAHAALEGRVEAKPVAALQMKASPGQCPVNVSLRALARRRRRVNTASTARAGRAHMSTNSGGASQFDDANLRHCRVRTYSHTSGARVSGVDPMSVNLQTESR